MRAIVRRFVVGATALLLTGAAPPGTPGATSVVSDAAVRAQVAAMLAEMRPDQGFLWRPLVRDGARVAAIEVWKKPGRPAVHPAEAEYAIVLEGAGTLVSGGTLVAPATRRDGMVEGERIAGGSTRALARGDVLLIPAGVPHWFGITGDHLVLLGTKLPADR
ncbi:cupin domain-containing protein [Sphingomonas sp. RHCKR7]|uniref:cupin domain-containing protein n=1 Tax=Sphingomonas folli TaxID=2862497 RepID=UPI001C684F41|nr:cupin domain-containing protein [Sphingomonas folli]MBW6528687.1 cupin domain-containing protein [Sphingomonas folli]